MSLRKFGTERARPEVVQEDPQGLSRTAMRGLEGAGDLPEEEEPQEAPEPAERPENR